MPITIYRDADIELRPLLDRTVAVLGYGNQGRAHALNLRDSGLRVIVGQRSGGVGEKRARDDGFTPRSIADAAGQADFIILALPDEAAPAVYRDDVGAHLRSRQTLGFIHGFNIHYRQIKPPESVDVVMVAPKGAGYAVRRAFSDGHGVPCLAAVHQDHTGQAWPAALAWAKALGGGRAGVLKTTFAEETETDLFGEQVSVVGGVTALMKTAFQTLVEAGYQSEHAYFECVHEVKFVVDLIHERGLAGMREAISDTAAFGELTRGPRLAEAVRPVMRTILEEIRSGRFAAEWIAEQPAERRHSHTLKAADAESTLERVGEQLRRLLHATHSDPGRASKAAAQPEQPRRESGK